MGVHNGDNKRVVTTEPKTIHFDLSKDVDNNLKHEINSIIKHNEILAEHTTQNNIRKSFSKYIHGNNIHKHRKQ